MTGFKEGQPLPKAKLVQIEWTDENDLLTLFKGLQVAESDLQLVDPYDLYLVRGPATITDQSGNVGQVNYGALVTRVNEIPQIIITEVNLDKPTKYMTSDPLGNVIQELVTTRQDEIIIRVAEELYHLRDHLNGKIPNGTIDTAETDHAHKYQEPGFEQDAMLYRFSLLAKLLPEKWHDYNQTIDRISPRIQEN